MAFIVENPFFVLTAGLIPVVWFFILRRSSALENRTSVIVTGVTKSLLILLISLALCDIRLKEPVDHFNFMVCLDVTHSTRSTDSALVIQFLNSMSGLMGEKDTAGLIAFGKEPFVEQEPAALQPFEPLKTIPDKDRTNIEKAILAAAGRFPEKGNNRILLISDGNENMGNASDAAILARSLGIEIWSVPLDSWFAGNEVYIESLQTPQTMSLQTPFTIRIIISGTARTSSEVILMRDSTILMKRKIDLSPGKNLVTFNDYLESDGIHVYRAVVNAGEDRVFENNEQVAFTIARQSPKVLCLSMNRSSAFTDALKIQGIDADIRLPSDIPDSLNAFFAYEAVIIDNIPATAFSMTDMEHMESFVKDTGGGMMLLGGENSFGAGYYLNTPIEKALPVFMDHPTTLEKPEFCLVLIIDKSSSMSGSIENNTKLQGAKIAAFSAVELLNPLDRIGILAFDTDYSWVVPIMPARDRETIAAELSRLSAAGGTDLFPALSSAFETLAAIDAQKKHVIILSDGKTEEADFKPLVNRMALAGITISTVAVGSGSDRVLMQNISQWGNGRAYYTNDADRIPRIFAGDTKIAAKSTILEESLPTLLEFNADMLSGIPLDDLPVSEGMVLTYPKPEADIIFSTPKGPLLLSRQYGLGRSVAFTGSFTGKWGKKWVEWPHFEQFVSQMVKWVKKTDPLTEYDARITRAGDTATFAVDVVDPFTGFVNNADLRLNLVFPSKRRQEISLTQTSPGRYEAGFPALETGEYYLTLHPAAENESQLPTRTFCMGIPYSEEYQSRGINTNLLQHLSRTTGGQLLDIARPPAALFDRTKQVMGPGKKLWPYFTMLFVFVFIWDVAFRKILELRKARQV